MRKKVIMSIVSAAVIAGGIFGGVELYLSKQNNEKATASVVKNNTVANKTVEDKKNEDKVKAEKEAEEKAKQETRDKKKAEEKKADEEKKAEDEKKETATKAAVTTASPKKHAQTLEEGYALCSKMWNAYNNENFDEAVRLYESITNKDAIAKIGTDKIRIYHGQNMNREIAKAQEYYNSGDYLKARIYIRKIINGNLLLPNQKQRAEELYNNAKSKVNPADEKKANAAFTNERAVQLIKEKAGCGPHDTFSDFHSYEDPRIGKVINCVLHKNGDPHNVVFYKVGIDGSVIEPD